jgi:hypothetical protein
MNVPEKNVSIFNGQTNLKFAQNTFLVTDSFEKEKRNLSGILSDKCSIMVKITLYNLTRNQTIDLTDRVAEVITVGRDFFDVNIS